MDFASAVRREREERGWTLQQLAERAGLSVSYLSEIEQGKKRPSLKVARRLSQTLGLPPTAIFTSPPPEEGGDGPGQVTLGARLRLAREARELTLEAVAQKVGISASYLSQIERDLATPSVATLRQLSEVLQVTPGQLVPPGRRDSLGAKLKTLRTNLGLSRGEVAQRAGVSVSLVAQIENGRTNPSLETLQRISDVLGISPCYLIVENPGLEQMLTTMTPELRELLTEPEVQSVLRMACTFSKKEFTFLLRFIQLLKVSDFS
ncbi:MAG: helix-turn-helix transcriptional regulator [Bacillota bacterium]|nr:helix-turn-helix transcriptional regulator [Bacillota bacterium]